MKDMYKTWSGFKISSNNFFVNLLNFLIPRSPFSWADTFGFSCLIFLIYRIKKKYYILLIILVSITFLISYLTNFQARWFIYVFLITFLITESRRFNFNKFNILINIYCYMLLSFFLIYTFYILILFFKIGMEPTREKKIYLYKFLKNYSYENKDTFIITNLRNNYHFKNTINYRYPEFSYKYLLKNHSNKKISLGIFSGISDLTEFNIQYRIPPICISKNETIILDVNRRNFLAEKFQEKIFIVNFDNNNLISCLQNNLNILNSK